MFNIFQGYQNINKRVAESQRIRLSSVMEKQHHEIKQQQHSQDAVSTEYLVHHWLEALFAWFQVIVLWHEPYVSLCAISGLLSSFLLLTYFAPRFYATIMIAIFIYNLNKFWFRHVWPDIRVPVESERELEQRLDVDRWTYLHPQLMTLKELKYHLSNLIRTSECYLERLILLRNHRPTSFCSLLCFIFTCTAYLGTFISGPSLVFSSLLIIILMPGIYAHLLNDEYQHWLKEKYQAFIVAGKQIDGQPEHENSTAKEQLASNDVRAATVTCNSGQSSAQAAKETIATSISNTMKSIESLFGNLSKKKNPATKTSNFQSSENEQEDDDDNESGPLLSRQLRQAPSAHHACAKVFYNLIDVTLMGSSPLAVAEVAQQQRDSSTNMAVTSTTDADDTSSGSQAHNQGESVPLLDNEYDDHRRDDVDQQDDGFVML